jgi:hypothetical protein
MLFHGFQNNDYYGSLMEELKIGNYSMVKYRVGILYIYGGNLIKQDEPLGEWLLENQETQNSDSD